MTLVLEEVVSEESGEADVVEEVGLDEDEGSAFLRWHSTPSAQWQLKVQAESARLANLSLADGVVASQSSNSESNLPSPQPKGTTPRAMTKGKPDFPSENES